MQFQHIKKTLFLPPKKKTPNARIGLLISDIYFFVIQIY